MEKRINFIIDLLIILIYLVLRLPLTSVINVPLLSPMLYRIVADSLIIVAMLLLLRTKDRFKSKLRNSLYGWKIPSLRDFGIGLVGAIVLLALVLSITKIIPRQFFYELHLATNIYQIISLLFIVSLTEELFYRSFFLHKLLSSHIPPVPSILIQALLFGLGHMYAGVGGALFSTIAGGILGLMMLRYKSITATIVAHFMYNMLYFTLHMLSNS